MLTTFTVVYDANVLYPAALRSLLMYLALSDLFRARWTKRIHQEWIDSLLRERPNLSREALEKTRRLMDAHNTGALITGYEDIVASLNGLPDENDRHVLAAAIRGNASVIVTCNLKDFPADILKPYGIKAQHPDEFIAHLFDLDPQAVLASARREIAKLKHPPITVEEFIGNLEKLQLPMTAAHLRPFLIEGDIG